MEITGRFKLLIILGLLVEIGVFGVARFLERKTLLDGLAGLFLQVHGVVSKAL